MPKKGSKRKPGSSGGGRSGGGIFSSIRGGMKSMVGTGKSKKEQKWTFWDVLFWLAAIMLGAAVVYRWLK
jgi:hypothetical protein